MRRGIRPVLSVSGAAVAAALLMGGLAACGSAGEATTPTPTVEPTSEMPSPVPEPADPLPEEPVAPVPDGTPDERDAEAAAEYFVELYQYAMATGDVEVWRERSHAECEFCASTVAQLADYAEARLSYTGGTIRHEPAQIVSFEPDLRVFAVEMAYEIDDVEVVDRSGAVVDEFLADSGFFLVEIGYQPSSGWMLFTAGHHDESFR